MREDNRWQVITDLINKYRSENSKSFYGKIGVITLILLFAIVFFVTGCNNVNEETDIEIQESIREENPADTVKYGNDGVNAGIAPDEDTSIVAESSSGNSETMVAMSVEDVGRADPFFPTNGTGYSAYVEPVSTAVSRPRPAYDLLPPPETITADETATEVMTTKVSGIMFDNYNPSAILNISGSDYLVRTGDIVNNYKVLSIGRESVTVQYGANIYKAGVGEIFAGDGLNFNTISNLESKFGGRKNSANRN